MLVKLLGPVQRNAPFNALIVEFKLTPGVLQRICPPVAVTVGAVKSLLRLVLAVAVQPLLAVAVTVYVPAVCTVGLFVVLLNPLGPSQA